MAELLRASHQIRIVVIALALMSGSTHELLAQDVTTTTPPELRDFRLDAPTAAPETPPPVTPAPSPEPTQPRPAPAPQVLPPPASTAPGTQASPSTLAPTASSPAPVETQAAPDADSLPPPKTQPTSASPAPSQAAPVKQPSTADGDAIRVGVIMALLGLAVAGGLYWRRRRTKAAPAAMQSKVRAAPPSYPKLRSTPVKTTAKPPAQSLSPAVAPPPAAKAATLSPQSPLTMAFVPDAAVVSLANLVVRGQLQVANQGPDIIQGLTVRAALIAASAQQQQAIDNFFADPNQIPPSPVGALNPGEQIGLRLELSMALCDMQTFALGDKMLLVPILLAVVSYDNAEPQQAAQLVTMIGREANPPTEKMGPLRLDLGPRSFGQLGQRPLPA